MNRSVLKGMIGLTVTSLSALAFSTPVFYSTGQGLVSGQADNHWTITKIQGSTSYFSPGRGYVMNDSIFPVVGAYEHVGYTNSKWISFTPDGYCNSDDIFKFSQKVWIDASNLGNQTLPDIGQGIRFSGQFSSDNASEMYLNGSLVSGLPYYEPVQGYSWQARKGFSINSGFVAGWNEISFLVGSASTMGGNEGPMEEWMALRVEGQFAAVPEPASLTVVGLGFVALLKKRRAEFKK